MKEHNIIDISKNNSQWIVHACQDCYLTSSRVQASVYEPVPPWKGSLYAIKPCIPKLDAEGPGRSWVKPRIEAAKKKIKTDMCSRFFQLQSKVDCESAKIEPVNFLGDKVGELELKRIKERDSRVSVAIPIDGADLEALQDNRSAWDRYADKQIMQALTDGMHDPAETIKRLNKQIAEQYRQLERLEEHAVELSKQLIQEKLRK